MYSVSQKLTNYQPDAVTGLSGQVLRIAYTLGDLAGIGEEIFYKFFEEYKNCPWLKINLIDEKLNYQTIQNKIKAGQASAYAGEHSFKALEYANQAIIDGEFDYLVTGPVAKESLWLAGIQCSGQTELLAQINQLSRDDIEMFFVLDQLRVVLATRHVPIVQVSEVLKVRLSNVLSNSVTALEQIWNISSPSIAVAGLNPHAGENGILGEEEKLFIKPTIDSFRELNPGVDISGPYPADSLFAKAAQNYLNEPSKSNQFDLYISAYHDQALPLIKGLGGLRAINLTSGLPYIRLSVDHGTGFDIVGQNIANPEGLYACTNYCLELSHNKRLI
jgi:4-hydroxythreonine-4-phosphate dehydrogenase